MARATSLTVLLAAALAAPGVAHAQASVSSAAILKIEGLGRVSAQSPLQRGPRERARAVWVTGTVATVHVGPYVLQARLAGDLPDTVLVRDPVTRAFTRLTTTTWIDVAAGPGGKNVPNPVAFLLVRGGGAREAAVDPEALAVAYRVVP